MKKLIALAMATAFLFSGCSEIKPVVMEVPPPQKKQIPVPETSLPTDKLQELFLQITPKTTKEEIEAYVAANGLYINKDRYDYKIAFRESDATFKRGTSGDAVTVSFNKDWSLKYGEYFHGENYCHAFIISGTTPDDRANYMFRNRWNKEEEFVPTAVTALRLAVTK